MQLAEMCCSMAFSYAHANIKSSIKTCHSSQMQNVSFCCKHAQITGYCLHFCERTNHCLWVGPEAAGGKDVLCPPKSTEVDCFRSAGFCKIWWSKFVQPINQQFFSPMFLTSDWVDRLHCHPRSIYFPLSGTCCCKTAVTFGLTPLLQVSL